MLSRKHIIQENDYYPFGSTFRSVGSSSNRYMREGKEYVSDHGWNKHDYHARTADLTGRLSTLQIDPMAEMFYHLSPYALFGNNPLRFADPTGRTLEERLKALEVARSLIGTAYKSALPANDRVKNGQLDCSGLVRFSIMQNSSINDPFIGKEGNGVTRIMESSQQVGLNDIRDGDLVVIKSGNNENGHVGFVQDVVRENGNVTQYTILHSESAWTNSQGQSGGGDVNDKSVVEVGSEKGFARSKYNHRFYQWDTPEATTPEQPKDPTLEELKLRFQELKYER